MDPALGRTVRAASPRRAQKGALRRRPPAPRSGSDWLASGPSERLVTLPRFRGRASFWLGVILLLLSFGIYPAYPLVPFLPISLWQKGGVGIALAAVSWTMFLAGSALVGKKGLAYLKGWFPGQREDRSRPDLGQSVPRRLP